MADIRIADQTIAVLQKSLDLRAQKQQVIAGNVANADTPGYSARKLDFEDNLRKAINTPEMAGRKTNPKHFPIGGGGISRVQGTLTLETSNSTQGDGNTVSVDDEMFDLAENQLLYEAGSQMLKKKFSMLKFAASNGS
ncbi:flagellar basal-body rod protein FlgB [Desulfuromusa kysingii]|uniref:Flagellar basal body rod protein FlgB n=1 Tax=Desulfuromusa kysingii TaxID=37625 RepID=A0A1H3VHK0_9BACT|nr:flagellar basal body rod protein FlgB [Desulfuromusa kysingii]SDZ74273.1 flagellar basal-body rod protein FlgB [Desulfuromusa kysingii]